MRFIYNLFFVFIFIFLLSCKSNKEPESVIEDASIDIQMINAYEEGIKELEKGDVIIAAKKFNEAELLFPQSIWAPRASLMAAYSYFSQDYYQDSIFELERFLKTYPNHVRRDYAYYLLAMSYYNQIVDEKKDLEPIIKSKKYFNIIIQEYPNTDFALDANYKLDLIQEILASKEMYIARYYIDREKWIPAIERYKIILNKYGTTIFVEEAIHRLVEIHYKIGLIEESKKYANLLGYNYQSSEWYEKSYKIFNKDYSTRKQIKKENKKGILKRFKSLIQ